MADPTIFERPYTGAYDEAVTLYAMAHPEPGPTYEEIKARLFPPEPPRPIVPRYDAPPVATRESVHRNTDWPVSSQSSSSAYETGSSLAGLPLGIAIGMMF